MLFGTQADLLARLKSSFKDGDSRPLALLSGSGLSQPAVPNVNTMILLLRKGLDVEEQREFDEVLLQHSIPADKYQAAFQFLSFRRPPQFRDRVIRLATLSAFNAGDAPLDATALVHAGEFEAHPDKWKLPDGMASLGRIWAGLPPSLRGPILTTNFDPLTEIAIRRAGGNATTQVHSDDSSFLTNMRVQVGSTVVHLHGYWRESATLNTQEQLSQERPALSASLRVVLQQHTLLVVAYGGWSDVITKQILNIVREQSSDDLDVLWCMFESGDALESAFDKSPTLAALRTAPGNVQFYAGIDANSFFPELERSLAGSLSYSSSSRSIQQSGNLVGWTSIEQDYLEGHNANATAESALSFFDGRLPGWRDAINDLVPVRDVTNTVKNSIIGSIDRRESTFTSLIGPSGEGKSTAALQVAVALTAVPSTRVLFHGSDYFGSDKEILELPQDHSYVLVVDEAHRFVERLRSLTQAIHESGRKKIHILAISRDTDWQSAGGANFLWSRYLPSHQYRMNGVSRLDAVAIVQAWEAIGARALGALQSYATSDQRVDALIRAANDTQSGADGSLLGALLTTRYGSGLKSHVEELMTRARAWGVPTTGSEQLTRQDALVFIALPQANGVNEMTFKVLARALQVSEPELHANVLAPLGQEAAISYESGRVLIRHRLIAKAICEIAEENGYDLTNAIRRVVSAAAQTLDGGVYQKDMGRLAYLSGNLPTHPQFQLVAAQAAVDAVPHQISYRTSLSAALRKENRSVEASESNESSMKLFFRGGGLTAARPFFTEWGVVEGTLGRWARNAVFVGLSLQDNQAFEPITIDKSTFAISCFLRALKKGFVATNDARLIQGMAAGVVLAQDVVSPQGLVWVREAEALVENTGTTFPELGDSADLQRALQQACNFAKAEVELPLPNSLPLMDFRFQGLIDLVQRRSVR